MSKGPDLVLVPDVTFESIEQATADLQSQGLQVGNVSNYRPGGIVESQQPDGGTGATAAARLVGRPRAAQAQRHGKGG